MKDLLKRCSARAGCDEKLAEAVVQAFLDEIARQLVTGDTVDLGRDFGVFSVKLREGKLQPGSPRTPKTPHYKVVFREGSGLKQRLKRPFHAAQNEDLSAIPAPGKGENIKEGEKK